MKIAGETSQSDENCVDKLFKLFENDFHLSTAKKMVRRVITRDERRERDQHL